MLKEIKVIDREKGICRVTSADERWYSKTVIDKTTGLPVIGWNPSVTFITSSYPKGTAYMQWLAKHGWDEAEAIKADAGSRGDAVHKAIERTMNEGSLNMDDMVLDRDGKERQLTPEEWYHVVTFFQWHQSVGSPKPLAVELTVESAKYGYTGTLDYLFKIDGKVVLMDVKTSKYIWPSHELQVSALKQAVHEFTTFHVDTLAILQTGYMANKAKHFKYTEIDDQFPLFLATKEIWAKEHGSEKPLQRDYPISISVGLTTDDSATTEQSVK